MKNKEPREMIAELIAKYDDYILELETEFVDMLMKERVDYDWRGDDGCISYTGITILHSIFKETTL